MLEAGIGKDSDMRFGFEFKLWVFLVSYLELCTVIYKKEMIKPHTLVS
jgi:hypothetical protein